MIALCVDDEILLLNALKRAVSEAECIDEVYSFDDELDALEWAENNRFDIAFLDVQLHDMDGIQLAAKLREKNPDLPVIFCTGYQQYAVDAFAIHANGFLMKPITKEAVSKELGFLFKNHYKISVKGGSHFSVSDINGKLIKFKRAKTLELFKYLLKQNGEYADSEKICDALWEDNDIMLENNKAYLRQLTLDLNKSLSEIDASDVFIRDASGYAFNMSLIKVSDK